MSFAVIAYLLKRSMQKFYKLVEEEVHSKNTHIQANEYLAKAQSEADSILKNAHLKADQILAQTSTFTTQERAQLEDEIRKSAEAQAEQYGSVLNDLVKLIRDDTAAELNSFSGKLLQYITEIEKSMRADADKRIEEYKKQWFQKIDNSMEEIVQTAAKNIIGHQLTVSEQEDYVMKVLEDAKSTHVF